MGVLDNFWPSPIGFRHVHRCRGCDRLVHTAEASDDEGRKLILEMHRDLTCPDT